MIFVTVVIMDSTAAVRLPAVVRHQALVRHPATDRVPARLTNPPLALVPQTVEDRAPFR